MWVKFGEITGELGAKTEDKKWRGGGIERGRNWCLMGHSMVGVSHTSNNNSHSSHFQYAGSPKMGKTGQIRDSYWKKRGKYRIFTRPFYVRPSLLSEMFPVCLSLCVTTFLPARLPSRSGTVIGNSVCLLICLSTPLAQPTDK